MARSYIISYKEKNSKSTYTTLVHMHQIIQVNLFIEEKTNKNDEYAHTGITTNKNEVFLTDKYMIKSTITIKIYFPRRSPIVSDTGNE